MKAELNIEPIHKMRDSVLDTVNMSLDQEGEFVVQLNSYYKSELAIILNHAYGHEEVRINFSPFHKTPHQHEYIAEFSVLDLTLPEKDSYNWHGQNTSQWLYAGALVYDPESNEISSHH